MNIGEIVVTLRAELRQFTAAFKTAQATIAKFAAVGSTALTGLTGAIRRFALAVTRYLGATLRRNLRRAMYAFIGLTAGAIKAFADFEKQMATVSTMLNQTTMQLLPGMTRAVQSLAIDMAQSTQTLTAALFDILSAQIPAQKALDFLQHGAQLAVAGATEAKITTAALITVMEAYKVELSDVAAVSDRLFATMEQGRVTLADVAENIGVIAAQASIAGVDMESMMASFAAISRVLDPFKTTTALRAIYTQIRKTPTDDQAKIIKKLGLEWEAAAFSGDKLVETIRKLAQATDAELQVLFPNVRGLTGLAVALQKVNDLGGIQAAIVDSAGSTWDAYQKMVKTVSFQMGRLKQAFLGVLRNAVQPFGDALRENTRDLANWLRDGAESVRAFSLVVGHNLGAVVAYFKTDWNAAWRNAYESVLVLTGTFITSLTDLILTGITNLVRKIPGAIAGAMPGLWRNTMDVFEELKTHLEAGGGPRGAVAILKGLVTGSDAAGVEDLDSVLRRVLDKWRVAGGKLVDIWESDLEAAGIATKTWADAQQEILEARLRESAVAFALSTDPETGEPMDFSRKKNPEDEGKKLVDAMKEAAASVKAIWDQLADDINMSMSEAFADVTTRAKSLTEALTDMLNQIHRALSQEVFQQLLWPSIHTALGLPDVKRTTPQGPEQDVTLARGGLVPDVRYAARGLFRPRGSDVVPAMLTPGEEVVQAPIVDYIKRTQAQPPQMNINISAIGPEDTYRFFQKNQRTIASMMQSAMRGNHPLRRDK